FCSHSEKGAMPWAGKREEGDTVQHKRGGRCLDGPCNLAQKGRAPKFLPGPCLLQVVPGTPAQILYFFEKKAYSAAPPSSVPGCTAAWKGAVRVYHAVPSFTRAASWGDTGPRTLP